MLITYNFKLIIHIDYNIIKTIFLKELYTLYNAKVLFQFKNISAINI